MGECASLGRAGVERSSHRSVGIAGHEHPSLFVAGGAVRYVVLMGAPRSHLPCRRRRKLARRLPPPAEGIVERRSEQVDVGALDAERRLELQDVLLRSGRLHDDAEL